ncbi:unnamed protein product [Urochloa decumbens]|uniref:Uncharacterized protein n=1 Tax=Urochloa decumbens TaxID=240449 RepID=A0ABC9BY67_9POAL
MAIVKSSPTRRAVHLIAVAMFLAVMYSTLSFTTYADQAHEDICEKMGHYCEPIQCSEECTHKYHYKAIGICKWKNDQVEDECCCRMRSPAPNPSTM